MQNVCMYVRLPVVLSADVFVSVGRNFLLCTAGSGILAGGDKTTKRMESRVSDQASC